MDDYCSITVANHELSRFIRFVSCFTAHLYKNFVFTGWELHKTDRGLGRSAPRVPACSPTEKETMAEVHEISGGGVIEVLARRLRADV